MTKISIIVPIYNTENHLRKCLESLVNQTLEEIEIILVNDASPDDSNVIMEEYQQKYPDRVKCIYFKKNMSQGGARNKGIKIASGEYIMFVDSDDWIHTTMCEKLYNKAAGKDYDIVGCDFYKVNESTGKKRWNSLYFKQQVGKLTQKKKSSLLFMFPIPWAKIVRRSLIIENQLYFPIHMKYEDAAVVPLYFVYANTMGIVEKPLYYYNIREESTSHLPDAKHHGDSLKSGEMIYKQFKDRDLTNFQEEAEGLYLKQIFNSLRKSVLLFDTLDKKELKYIGKILKKKYPECRKNHYYYSATDAVGRKLAELLESDINEVLALHEEESASELRGYRDFYQSCLNRIDLIFDYCREYNFKVAIWGGGVKGNDFLSVVDNKRKKVTYAIDSAKSKEGEEMETGHSIVESSAIETDLDFVIIMDKYNYRSVKHTIKKINKEIKVFNLEIYLLMKDSKVEAFVK